MAAKASTVRRNGTARDNQRQRLYDAEDTARHRLGLAGHRIKNEDLQAYVDKVLQHRAVQARWGQVRLTVGLTHGGGRANVWGREITLGTWARNEMVILHEIAHHLAHQISMSAAEHGPEFAGVFKFLVKTMLGRTAWEVLTEEFKNQRVRSNNGCVPAPEKSRVVTKAERDEKARARKARILQEAERDRMRAVSHLRRVAAAETLRMMIEGGVFGPTGSVERRRALAVARKIEKGQ
jgi:hypothetical protein